MVRSQSFTTFRAWILPSLMVVLLPWNITGPDVLMVAGFSDLSCTSVPVPPPLIDHLQDGDFFHGWFDAMSLGLKLYPSFPCQHLDLLLSDFSSGIDCHPLPSRQRGDRCR
jgi:hypothetical protein